jgi:hypothetical protein
LRAIASRSTGTPAIGGYWFSPERIAVFTASSSAGSQSKSGKPWPRLTAPCCAASADITVKMVVPTAGRRLVRTGVRAVTAFIDRSALAAAARLGSVDT